MTENPAIGAVNPYARLRPAPEFRVTSLDIRHGEPLPREQFAPDAGGFGRSPQLSWSGAPPETRSFAVTCYDPDAPTGSGFWHWAVAELPGEITSLAANTGDPAAGLLPPGSIMLPNELREPGFAGAAPPEGTGVHHYWFVVHALNVERLGVDPEATPAVLGFLMRDAVVGRGILVATAEFGGAA